MSVYQCVVLLLFNTHRTLRCADMCTMTHMERDDLTRTLQSLALGKARVLLKSSKVWGGGGVWG